MVMKMLFPCKCCKCQGLRLLQLLLKQVYMCEMNCTTEHMLHLYLEYVELTDVLMWNREM